MPTCEAWPTRHVRCLTMPRSRSTRDRPKRSAGSRCWTGRSWHREIRHGCRSVSIARSPWSRAISSCCGCPRPARPSAAAPWSTTTPSGTAASAPQALPPNALLVSAQGWERLANAVQEALKGHHTAHRLRRGLPREELRERLGQTPRVFTRLDAELLRRGLITEDGPFIRLP